jgi:hypothetical protein
LIPYATNLLSVRIDVCPFSGDISRSRCFILRIAWVFDVRAPSACHATSRSFHIGRFALVRSRRPYDHSSSDRSVSPVDTVNIPTVDVRKSTSRSRCPKVGVLKAPSSRRYLEVGVLTSTLQGDKRLPPIDALSSASNVDAHTSAHASCQKLASRFDGLGQADFPRIAVKLR